MYQTWLDLIWCDLSLVNVNVRKELWWKQTVYNTILSLSSFSSLSKPIYLSIFHLLSVYVFLSLSLSFFLLFDNQQASKNCMITVRTFSYYLERGDRLSVPAFMKKNRYDEKNNAKETCGCTLSRFPSFFVGWNVLFFSPTQQFQYRVGVYKWKTFVLSVSFSFSFCGFSI